MATRQAHTAFLWSYSKPIKALVRRESVKAFDSFVIIWNKFKETSDYQTCPENIKSTINRLVDDFKILEDEEEK